MSDSTEVTTPAPVVLDEPLSWEQRRRQAAIAFVSLGPDRASEIARFMNQTDLDELMAEVYALGRFTPDEALESMRNFTGAISRGEYAARGGPDFTRRVLEQSFGPERADEAIARLTNVSSGTPFERLRRTDPSQIFAFLQNEDAQTIALVLSYLPSHSSAFVLGMFPPERQALIGQRIASIDRTSPEVLRIIEGVVERKLANLISHGADETSGGVKSLVDIMNHSDRATERAILEHLEATDPELAEEVKKLMFVFEDIIVLDQKAVQKVLKEVETKDLALAMRNANPQVRDLVTNNLSERATAILEEEIGYLPARVPRKNVEEAQGRVVAIVRRLEQDGEIEIHRPSADGGDEYI